MSLNSIRRPTRSMCLLSLALLSFGASACKPIDGTPDDDDDQPATPIEADDAAEVLAQQICEQLFTCECPNTTEYGSPGDCVANETAEIAAQIDAVLDAGGTWDPECAGQMAKAMSDWECLGPTMAARETSYSPLTCPAIKGARGVGNDCTRSPLGDDCQAGLICLNGTCVEQPQLPVPDGQSCNYGDLPCESGSYCGWDPEYSIQICQAVPKAGDACSENEYLCGPAGADLVCELGTCTPTPGEGESCEEWLMCAPGFYCDGGKNFTCQPRQELGEGCGGDSVCPVDSSCVASLCEADPAVVCNATSLF